MMARGRTPSRAEPPLVRELRLRRRRSRVPWIYLVYHCESAVRSGRSAVPHKFSKTNMAVKNYRDLIVWQKSMDLVAAVYLLAEEMPRSETIGLVGQMKRAVVSVPANIAEGEGRGLLRTLVDK